MERKKITITALSPVLLLIISSIILGISLTFSPTAGASDTDLWRQQTGGSGYFLKTGTVYGAVPVTGQIGNALQFDGTNDYMNITADERLDLTGPLTFAAWIKPGLSHNGNSGTILTKNKEGSYSYYWAIGGGTTTENKKLAIYLGGVSPSGWKYSSSDLPCEEWIHIATTFDGNTVKHYVNGILDNTITGLSGTITTTTQPLTIGQRTDYLNTNYQFNGAIDDLVILGTALPGNEIAALYQDGLNGTGVCADGDGVCLWTDGIPTGNIFYNDGNVGIGTVNPASKLEVEGTIYSKSGGIKFPDGTTQVTAATSSVFGDRSSLDAADGNPVDAVYVDNDGNVGIGSINPATKLEVAGTIRSTSGGIQFPDGTSQLTAATGAPAVYDSGWFSGITSWTVYVKEHGFSTPPRQVIVQARHNPTGNIIFVSSQLAYGYSYYAGLACIMVNNTHIKIQTAWDRLGVYIDSSNQWQHLNFNDASLRILAWQ